MKRRFSLLSASVLVLVSLLLSHAGFSDEPPAGSEHDAPKASISKQAPDESIPRVSVQVARDRAMPSMS